MNDNSESSARVKTDIRVESNGTLGKYVGLGLGLFKGGERTVTISGIGYAVSKVTQLAETIKRKIGGLHQLNSIESVEVNDYRREAEQGATRNVALLKIVLSHDELDTTAYGYQEPIAKEEPHKRPRCKLLRIFVPSYF